MATERDQFLTTGEVAKLCSVTPDAVRKWIRSGRLPARRTAGGHHRVRKMDLNKVFGPVSENRPVRETADREFLFCWKFHGDGEKAERCEKCAVFQVRAQRCYEVARRAPAGQHLGVFCEKDCVSCDYFKEVNGQPTNVLVVTDDPFLRLQLLSNSESRPFVLKVTDCEYNCSAVVGQFKPDFVFVDCSLGKERSRDISFHLVEDPRLPFVRVILAGDVGGFPEDCEAGPFGRMVRPFTVEEMIGCMESAGWEGGTRVRN